MDWSWKQDRMTKRKKKKRMMRAWLLPFGRS